MSDNQTLYDKLGDGAIARLEGMSAEAVRTEGQEAQRELNKILGAVPTEVKGDNETKYVFKDDEHFQEKLGCTAMEAKERLAKVNAHVSECRKISNEKLAQENWQHNATNPIPGRKEAMRDLEAKQGPRNYKTLGDMFQEFYGHKMDLSMKDITAGKCSDEVADFRMDEVLQVFTTGGAGSTPPAGVTPRSPKATDQITKAIDLRGGLISSMPVYEMPNNGSEYIYDREAEGGTVATAGYGKGENETFVSQEIGAQTYTQKLVKRAAHTAFSNESLEDLADPLGQLIEPVMMRLMMEDAEKQLIQGNNNGSSGSTANDINGIAGSGSGSGRKGQTGTQVVTGAAADTNLLGFWNTKCIGQFEKPRNATGNTDSIPNFGAGVSPTHVVISNSHFRDLLGQTGSDGHYLSGNALSGAMNQLWGINIVRSDFLENTNNGTALLLNIDPANMGVAYKRGLTRRFGLDGGDLKADRQSVVYSIRWNFILKRPRMALVVRNLARKSSGYTA